MKGKREHTCEVGERRSVGSRAAERAAVARSGRSRHMASHSSPATIACHPHRGCEGERAAKRRLIRGALPPRRTTRAAPLHPHTQGGA